MLNTQKVANYLNGRLEALGELKFDIKAETGKHRNNNKINGIIKVVGDTSTNRAGFVNVTYDYAVELVIPAGVSNDNYIKVQDVVNALIDADNGKTIEIGNGTGTITFSVGRPENFKVDAGVGEDVPLMFHVKLFYTEGGVLGGDKHWLLDGEEIPFIKEQVILQKEAKKSKIKNRKTSQSAVSGQDKVYSFVLQYDANNLVCQKLQKAIIEGDFDTKYYLTYYDDVTYTQESPFKVCVSLLNTGNDSNDIEQVGMLSVSFMEADDIEVSKFRAFINLISFPFYDNDDNTLYSSDPNVIAEYMNNHSMGRVAIEAPNIDNLTITSQIVNIGSRSIGEVFRYNYAQIDLEKYDDGGEFISKETYYYFITGMTQGANEQVVVDLKMDTIQTYLMASWNRPALRGFIERASLDRFKVMSSGVLRFDNEASSMLFEKENTQGVAKRMVVRKPLHHKITSGGDTFVDKWFAENVIGWQYYYISGTGATGYGYVKIKAYGLTSDTATDTNFERNYYKNFDGGQMQGVLLVCAIPVLKSGKELDIDFHFMVGSVQHIDKLAFYGNRGISGFATLNNGFSRIVSTKFSVVPPFSNIIASQCSLNSTGNTLTIDANAIGSPNLIKTGTIRFGDDFTGEGLIIASPTLAEEMEVYHTDVNSPIVFSKTDENIAGQEMGRFWKTTYNDYHSIRRPDPRYIKKLVVAFGGYTSQAIPNEETTTAVQVEDSGLRVYLQIKKYKVLVNVVDVNSSTPSNIEQVSLMACLPKIIGAKKSPIFNPKLLSSDFKALKLTNERGEGFEYDLQKVNKNVITTKYTELPTPDISRSYFRITGFNSGENDDGVFIEECEQNLTGFVDSADMSLMVDNDQLSQMLAENKNYYLQKGIGYVTGAFGGAVGGALAGGSKAGVAGALVGGVIGTITSVVNNGLTEDNMRNSPNSVKNANGNAYFNVAYTTPAPTIEEYDILPAEKEIVNDYMVQFGFAYNQIGNLMDFLHKRKYFSYVKGNIDAMSPQGMRCNNMAFADLKARFANGIRFWNIDNSTSEFMLNYDDENYETMLENYRIFKDVPEEVVLSNTATSIEPNATYTTNLTIDQYSYKSITSVLVIVNNRIVIKREYDEPRRFDSVSVPNVDGDIAIIVSTRRSYPVDLTHRPSYVSFSNTDAIVYADMPYTNTISVGSGYSLSRVKVQQGSNIIIDIDDYEAGVTTETIELPQVDGALTIFVETRAICLIVANLENSTMTNEATAIFSGDDYTTTIIANEGYHLHRIGIAVNGSSTQMVFGNDDLSYELSIENVHTELRIHVECWRI